MNERFEILTGRDDSNIIFSGHFNVKLHSEVEESLLELREMGRNEGFEISLCSGYRDYQTQLSIWNKKARGDLKLLDKSGCEIEYSTLSKNEIIKSILRWSAIPGASRHHWGTDIDIYDKNTTPKNYNIELVPNEVSPNGIYGRLHLWLDRLIKEGKSFGFFRPYEEDLGGVFLEKWHLSYAPISEEYRKQFSIEVFEEVIKNEDLELSNLLQNSSSHFYNKYVNNISKCPFKF